MLSEVECEIRDMVERETRAWNDRDPEALVELFHPDMVWPWPPTSDPTIRRLGFFRRDDSIVSAGRADGCISSIRMSSCTVRIAISDEEDGAFAVVDVDTLWRDKSERDFHWKGRACKGYTRIAAEWKMIFHTGLLDYSMLPP
jgi:hypothetical protein